MNTKELLEYTDVIVILSGAGMGVDSGLPDFRGNEGMWKEYPELGKKGIDFSSIANPKMFKKYPKLAWTFYGHRFDTYKNTTPNAGFDMLLDLAKEKEDYFVVTSNVDGHFQKAGFDTDKVYEIHGRINKFQCTECSSVWKASEDTAFNVDKETFEMDCELPACPECGSLARPNIMMFNDYGFDAFETSAQEDRFNSFMNKNVKAGKKILMIEIGAGTAIPTIRSISENIYNVVDEAQLIRINPRESFGPDGIVSIAKGGLEALREIMPERLKK